MVNKLTLAVRMYCLGLGDCFLLRFGTAEGPFNMLVDCGMFVGSPGLETRLSRVVEDIKEATGGIIHLLLVTHQHYDHLSGFMVDAPRALWEGREQGGIDVERVWMGWTEEEHGLGGQVREAYKGRAKRLREFLRTLKERDTPVAGGRGERERPLYALLGDLLGFGDQLDADFGLVSPLDEAMQFVKRRVEAPEYRQPGEGPLTIDALPGVRFYILGPPMNEELLNSDPARGTGEAYELDRGLTVDGAFYAAPAFSNGDDGRNLADYPFHEDVGILIDAEPGESSADWEKEARAFFARQYKDPANRWRQIETDWLGVVGDLALQLDADTNNTSLAIAVELVDTGEVLLFPGDAQAGSWRSWHTLTWRVSDGQGREREVTMEELLRRTSFYKVGHHGSHNATLRAQGLEQMGEDARQLIAMIPTDETFARRKGKDGWRMPFGPLYRRLLEKTGGRVIRADHGLPSHVNGALELPATVRELLSSDLRISDDELGVFLKTISPGEIEWRRFASSVKAGPTLALGPDVYEGPLYYELDILR